MKYILTILLPWFLALNISNRPNRFFRIHGGRQSGLHANRTARSARVMWSHGFDALINGCLAAEMSTEESQLEYELNMPLSPMSTDRLSLACVMRRRQQLD